MDLEAIIIAGREEALILQIFLGRVQSLVACSAMGEEGRVP